jgi:Na+/proline symporter
MGLNAGFVALAVNFVVTVAVSLVTATSPAVGPAAQARRERESAA